MHVIVWLRYNYEYGYISDDGLYLDTISRGQNQFAGQFTVLLGVSGLVAKLGTAAGGEEGLWGWCAWLQA